jgi:Fe-S-cluster containining protein
MALDKFVSSKKAYLIHGDKKIDFYYPKGINWRCKMCSFCCRDPEDRDRHILLLSSEIELLRREVREDFYKPVIGFKPFIGELYKKDGCCIFLNEHICRVYPYRPLLCRNYPFWIDCQDNVFRIGVDHQCPGLKEGKKLDVYFFKDLLRTALQVRG